MKLQELQQRKREEDPNAIDTKCCIICQKVIPAAYGRWNSEHGEVWTCCKLHEQQYKEQRDANSYCA